MGIDFEKLLSFFIKLCVECEKMLNVDLLDSLIFFVIKGKYFKNNKVLDKLVDIEIDGLIFIFVIKQWWWKDGEGKWFLFLKEENKRINKCYECYFKLIVVVLI